MRGDRLKEIRIKQGISQQKLADFLGVDRTTIGKYELKNVTPNTDVLKKMALFLNTTEIYLMGFEESSQKKAPIQGVKIPVLGRVVAGVPIEATTEILDYEEIHPDLACTGDFFALQIKGNSMSPNLLEGDIVIVKQQNTVESGDIAIVLVNGAEATVKKVKINENGIMLVAYNTEVYEPHAYTNDEIKELPVQILGKVIESRRKFL